MGIRQFAWKKNWPLLANLSEVIFIDEQCWHLEQTTLSGFKTVFIKKGNRSQAFSHFLEVKKDFQELIFEVTALKLAK